MKKTGRQNEGGLGERESEWDSVQQSALIDPVIYHTGRLMRDERINSAHCIRSSRFTLARSMLSSGGCSSDAAVQIIYVVVDFFLSERAINLIRIKHYQREQHIIAETLISHAVSLKRVSYKLFGVVGIIAHSGTIDTRDNGLVNTITTVYQKLLRARFLFCFIHPPFREVSSSVLTALVILMFDIEYIDSS